MREGARCTAPGRRGLPAELALAVDGEIPEEMYDIAPEECKREFGYAAGNTDDLYPRQAVDDNDSEVDESG